MFKRIQFIYLHAFIMDFVQLIKLKIIVAFLELGQSSPAAIEFCHKGRVYAARLDQCPGGLLLKPEFRHLPRCICAHGVFLYKGSSSPKAFDGIIANSELQCARYPGNHHDDWTLILPLTPPTSPFSETLSIIPYENDTDRLDYFHMRRYAIDAVLDEDAPPAKEDVRRAKILFVGNNNKRQGRQAIQVGNLCVEQTVGFNDGVYAEDFETASKPKAVHRVGDKCIGTTSTFHISRNSSIHQYKNYFSHACSLPPSCMESPETTFYQPVPLDFPSIDHHDDDTKPFNRLSRQANCDKITEENVQLAEYFTRMLHHQVVPYPISPDAIVCKVVNEAIQVYQNAVGNDVVPHAFSDQVFRYFYYLYFDKIDNRLDTEFATKLLGMLTSCKLSAREFHFVNLGCPAKVEYFKKPIAMFGYDLVKIHLNDSREYKEEQYDLIPEFVYKITNFVYNYCHKSLNVQLREFYKQIIMRLLLTPDIHKRWRKLCTAIPSSEQYRSILPYGDLNTIMRNVDLTVSVVMESDESWIERPELEQRKRRKRSVLDYENYEIWNRKAYCLQLNEYPKGRGPATWGILPDITRLISS